MKQLWILLCLLLIMMPLPMAKKTKKTSKPDKSSAPNPQYVKLKKKKRIKDAYNCKSWDNPLYYVDMVTKTDDEYYWFDDYRNGSVVYWSDKDPMDKNLSWINCGEKIGYIRNILEPGSEVMWIIKDKVNLTTEKRNNGFEKDIVLVDTLGKPQLTWRVRHWSFNSSKTSQITVFFWIAWVFFY